MAIVSMDELQHALEGVCPAFQEEKLWVVELIRFKGTDSETGEKLIGIEPRFIVRLIHAPTEIEAQIMIFPQAFADRSKKFLRDNMVLLTKRLARVRAAMRKLITPQTAPIIKEQAEGIFRRFVFQAR